MWKILTLLLPVLVPSWRFFQSVEPSPRVEWAPVPRSGDPGPWRSLSPRPATVSAPRMIGRLFWNPGWNEALYAVTCAERVLETGRPHGLAELCGLVRRQAAGRPGAEWVRFRILLVARQGGVVQREVAYLSDPFPAAS